MFIILSVLRRNDKCIITIRQHGRVAQQCITLLLHDTELIINAVTEVKSQWIYVCVYLCVCLDTFLLSDTICWVIKKKLDLIPIFTFYFIFLCLD